MYCGDETGALVGDFGSHSFKLGFGGEDVPKVELPSLVAAKVTETPATGLSRTYSCGTVAMAAEPRKREIIRPMRRGLVDAEKLDVVEELWRFGVGNLLHSEAKDHPMLLCDPSFNPLDAREKLLEMMFERLGVPASFLAPNAMLSAFSVGRPTALVVDVGASGSTVVPVKDGYLLRKCMRRSLIGGDIVTAHLLRTVETSVLDKKVGAPCTFSRKKVGDGETEFKVEEKSEAFTSQIHPSYLSWQKQEIIADMKKSVCRVWADLNFSEKAAAAYAPVQYELPDGTQVSLGAKRFASPELLLNPGRESSFVEYYLGNYDPQDVKGLLMMIQDSITRAHADSRREFLQQILVVGGGSLLPGTIERLQKECSSHFPSSLKTRFLTPTKTQRLYSVWTGGSILASLGSFQQLWLSKQEYEEYGAKSLILSKCTH